MSIIHSQNFPTHGIWSRRIIARLGSCATNIVFDESQFPPCSLHHRFPLSDFCHSPLTFSPQLTPPFTFLFLFLGEDLTFSPPPYRVLTIQTFQLPLHYSSTSFMVLVISNPQEIRFKPLHCKNQEYEGFLYLESNFLFFYLLFLILINC